MSYLKPAGKPANNVHESQPAGASHSSRLCYPPHSLPLDHYLPASMDKVIMENPHVTNAKFTFHFITRYLINGKYTYHIETFRIEPKLGKPRDQGWQKKACRTGYTRPVIRAFLSYLFPLFKGLSNE